MGVYIEGMEMPKDKEVFLRIDEKGEVYVYGSYPTELHKAVPVPPRGRLIDADALIAAHEQVCSRSMKFNLDLAPTIIPASEEGE